MEDLNQSLTRLQSFDLDGLEDVEACQGRWLSGVMSTLKVGDGNQLTADKFMGPTKQVLSRWRVEAQDVMGRQSNMMNDMKEMIELLKTEALADKEKVIRFQDKLLEFKDEQLRSLKSTVKATVETTVQNTVQKEIQSYSAAVTKKSGGPVLTPDSLKKVIMNAIEQEDRSKNLMVFGLAEEDGEQIEDKVAGLFAELGEKPRVAVSRMGHKKPGATTVCRPVKVTLASSTAAHQILSKARNLNQIERRKSVYVCPDRSPEERAVRKKLVMDLKKAAADQPDRQHFIKNGKVHSMDKT